MGMGGVDKFDQMIKYYSMKRKTNRWTQRFTIHILELLMHNSFVLYLLYIEGKTLSHYDFIEKIIYYFLMLSDKVSVIAENILNTKHHLLIKALKGLTVKDVIFQAKEDLQRFISVKSAIYICVLFHAFISIMFRIKIKKQTLAKFHAQKIK